MSSVKCKVNNMSNSSVAKPLMKKLYETHKKWLGGEKNNTKKCDTKTLKTSMKCDLVVARKKIDHSYENVEYRTAESTQQLSSKNAKEKKKHDNKQNGNVTVVQVPYEAGKNKLTIVINNFDKILEEYKAPPRKQATKIPKLQKAKTCSIIESKCILKKSLSQPLDSRKEDDCQEPGVGNLDSNKAKSMHNINNAKNFEDDDNSENKNLEEKSTEKHWTVSTIYVDNKPCQITNNTSTADILALSLKGGVTGTEIKSKVPPPVPEKKPREFRVNNNTTRGEKSLKVKELVERLNSLSSDSGANDKIEEKKEDLHQKEVVKEEIFEVNKVITKVDIKSSLQCLENLAIANDEKLSYLDKKPVLCKAVSNSDLSSSKEPVSKIAIHEKLSSLDSKPVLSKAVSNNDLSSSKRTVNKIANTEKPSPLHKKPVLNKAVSNSDLSSSKRTVSKIPVKSNLRRIYPSTPSGLNSLDHQNGCHDVGEAKSKMSNKFTRSVQNLSDSGSKLSLPKPVGINERNIGKSMENLARDVVDTSAIKYCNNSLKGLAEKSLKTTGKSMENLSFPRNKPLSLPKDTTSSKKCGIDSGKVYTKRDFVSAANSGHLAEMKTDSSPIHPSKSPDIALKIEKFDSSRENNEDKRQETKLVSNEDNNDLNKKVTVKARNAVQKNETFTKSKTKIDPANKFKTFTKYADLQGGSRTFTKPEKKVDPKNNTTSIESKIKHVSRKTPTNMDKTIKNTSLSKSPQEKNDTVKLDLKTTQKFIETIGLMECKNLYLDPNDFINIKDNQLIDNPSRNSLNDLKNSEADAEVKFINSSYNKLNYNSDDGSEDSGNISTEIEIDDQFSCSSTVRSRSSTDSLLSDDRSDRASSEGNLAIQQPVLSLPNNHKIFFRNGVLSQLESQRDERLAGMVVNLQAHCRGYLARRRLSQRKLQDLAVRCIQRNVRKFLLVRDWPWWRLLVRVTPLLNVHRTEEELKLKTDELEALKIKLDKVENDRTTLKHDKDKLEAKLSELTADLAEEHSTSTLAAERLDAETSERIKLERELSESQHKNKELQACSERLEMELLYAKSELNGIIEEEEDGEDGGVYKQRYERAVRELEFTKRRLQQQHEDDLEQLVGLKKQLEKKLTDAYEEVEEQRQVVGQWKRKVQKLNGEMNDLRLLLEEQSARNNLLEKKQRKFDSETQMLQDELKKEKQAKDRLSREKEVITAEKYALESTLADTRLELELKEEKFVALQREFDEITCGGKTEEEVTILRKQKIDCERRLQDQEEELDELAGQVQILEQAKLRLEMTLESMRKESKKETQMRDDELEEVRCNAQKKVKALEAQLENEHEERTLLLREKHELERRLAAAAESERNDRAGDEALLQRLKRDLKRTKALLRDTQAQLERQKSETPGKNMIRQLRNQLEDLECARSVAVKAKQTLETDLMETQASLEEANKQKNDAEERANVSLREKNDLQAQLEENEEELSEVLKKYKSAVQQMSLDQMALQEQVSLVSELEVEKNQLKEQLAELTQKLESMESLGDASSHLLVKRNELKIKELESKLDLEHTTKGRLEVQITRLKEAVDKLQNEICQTRAKEQLAQDQIRKLQRHLREVKEELNKSLVKESEALQKKKELEKRCEILEAEATTARTDLRLALKRIEDLQSAIQGELEDTPSDQSDSEQDTYSSDESVNTFLANHTLTPRSEKSTSIESRRLSSTSRSSTSNSIANHSSYA